MVLGYHIQYIKDLNDAIHYIQVSYIWYLVNTYSTLKI